MKRHPVAEWARRCTATVLPLLLPLEPPTKQVLRQASDVGTASFDLKSVVELQSQLLAVSLRVDSASQLRLVLETINNVQRDRQHAIQYLESWCTTTTQRCYSIATADELQTVLEHNELVLRLHLLPLSTAGPPHKVCYEKALQLASRLSSTCQTMQFPFLAPEMIYSKYIPTYIHMRASSLADLALAPERAAAAFRLAAETQLSWVALTEDLSDETAMATHLLAANMICYIQDAQVWLFFKLLGNYALSLLHSNDTSAQTTARMFVARNMIREKLASTSVAGLFARLQTRTDQGRRHQHDVFTMIKTGYTPSVYMAQLKRENATCSEGEIYGDALVSRHLVKLSAQGFARAREFTADAPASPSSPSASTGSGKQQPPPARDLDTLIAHMGFPFDIFRPPITSIATIKSEVERTVAALETALVDVISVAESTAVAPFSADDIATCKRHILKSVFGLE